MGFLMSKSLVLDLLKSLFLGPIPAEVPDKARWEVYVDGQLVRPESVIIRNPNFGTLGYAAHPSGKYAQWTYAENGGGGSVIIPYIEAGRGDIYIGVVKQVRPNQGGEVLNVPRGFLDAGETHFQAAAREGGEELGSTLKGYELFELVGDPANPNSTFFITAGFADDGQKKGVRCFGLRFPFAAVTGSDPFHFHDGILKPNPALKTAKLAEQITGCSFIHWSKAAQLGDMFTVTGTARLLAHLKHNPLR